MSGGTAQCIGHVPLSVQWEELRDANGCTWQPSGCRIRRRNQAEACDLLLARGHRRILVVGDSFMRHLYLALVRTLLGAAAERDPMFLAPTVHWHADSRAATAAGKNMSACSFDRVTDSNGPDYCRWHFASDTSLHLDEGRRSQLCGGKINVEYTHSPVTGAGRLNPRLLPACALLCSHQRHLRCRGSAATAS